MLNISGKFFQTKEDERIKDFIQFLKIEFFYMLKRKAIFS